MEFPGLGTHCSEPSCHQLDFLPYICPFCPPVQDSDIDSVKKHITNTDSKNLATTTVVRSGKRYHVYCGEHRSEHANCPGRKNVVVPTVSCPLCSTLLPVGRALDSSTTTATGTPVPNPPTEAEINTVVEKHILAGCKSSVNKCAVAKCKQKPISALQCRSCQKKLCGSHRYPEAHSCSAAAAVVGKGLSPAQAAAAARKPITVR